MREIKFRAWDTKVTQPMWTSEETLSLIMLQDRVLRGLAEDKDGRLERFKVMQFTGLKDKNGKEIYEGDIINNVEATQEPWMQVVEYSKDASFVRRDISEGDEDIWEFYGWDEVGQNFEIIGNIYENPELLKDAS